MDNLLLVSVKSMQHREEIERLQVRLSTVSSLWEDVLVLRRELETKLARTELKLRNIHNPSKEQLTFIIQENSRVWEESWAQIAKRVQSLEETATFEAADDDDNFFDLEFHTHTVRHAILTASLFQEDETVDTLSEVSPDDLPPPTPGPPPPWNMPSPRSLSPRPVQGEILLPPQGLIERASSALAKESAVLRLKWVKAEPEVSCVAFELDELRRRRCTIQAPCAWFHEFVLETSQLRISLYDSMGTLLARPIQVPISKVLEDSGKALSLGTHRVWLRADLMAAKNVAPKTTERARGGTHLSIPRFVKQLKLQKDSRDATFGHLNQVCTDDNLEAQLSSPSPDVQWLEQEALNNSQDGRVVYNLRRQTLLHVLCAAGSVESVRALLAHPRKPWNAHEMDESGWTPFMLMVSRQNVEGISMMLSLGCNANDGIFGGVSALHMAALTGNIEVAKLLLEHGALGNGVDDHFVTPLHYAVYAQRDALVRLFLDQPGVDTNICDNDGQSALTIAVRRKSLAALAMLLAEGALFLSSELIAVGYLEEKDAARVLQVVCQHLPAMQLHSVLIAVIPSPEMSDDRCVTVLRAFLKAGMSIDGVEDTSGRSILLAAAVASKKKTFVEALCNKANPLLRDLRGNNVAHLVSSVTLFDALMERISLEQARKLFDQRNSAQLLPAQCVSLEEMTPVFQGWSPLVSVAKTTTTTAAAVSKPGRGSEAKI